MDQNIRRFIKLCSHPLLKEHLDEIFNLFFTAEELENLSARYEIIQSLLQNKAPQRELSDQLHVSISQITRGSNALKRLSPSLNKKLISFFEESHS